MSASGWDRGKAALEIYFAGPDHKHPQGSICYYMFLKFFYYLFLYFLIIFCGAAPILTSTNTTVTCHLIAQAPLVQLMWMCAGAPKNCSKSSVFILKWRTAAVFISTAVWMLHAWNAKFEAGSVRAVPLCWFMTENTEWVPIFPVQYSTKESSLVCYTCVHLPIIASDMPNTICVLIFVQLVHWKYRSKDGQS